jgi:8-oxo-dGTP pyrophosphatase MutT (NUDIX family)
MQRMKRWRVLADQLLLDRRWLRIREQRIALPHGGEIEQYHVIEAPDWAAILALTEQGQVVLVDQYRHGLGDMSRELPAGVIDAQETPAAAALRELREETGFVAEQAEPLLAVCTETARHTARAHFFFARGARGVSRPELDPEENVAVHLLSVAELLSEVDRGAIAHGLHVAAILTAARRGLL